MFLVECLSSFSFGKRPTSKSPSGILAAKQKTQFGALLLIEEASLSVRKNKLRAPKRVCAVRAARRRCEPRKISISSTKIDVCNAADANTYARYQSDADYHLSRHIGQARQSKNCYDKKTRAAACARINLREYKKAVALPSNYQEHTLNGRK